MRASPPPEDEFAAANLLRCEFIYHKRLTMHENCGCRFEGLEAPRAARGEACPERSRRSVPRTTDCLPCRSGVRRQACHAEAVCEGRSALTLLASISSRLSFVCAALSETLKQRRYDQQGHLGSG